MLTEGAVLGGGAFSRVSIVTGAGVLHCLHSIPLLAQRHPVRSGCGCSNIFLMVTAAPDGANSDCKKHAYELMQMRCLGLAEETTRRVYALKRMRKSAVVQCPEHVFCEQVWLSFAAALKVMQCPQYCIPAAA